MGIVFLLFLSVSGVIAGLIWERKGGSFGAGFLLGFLLGLIGLLIAVAAKPSGSGGTGGPDATRACPSCEERMRRDSAVCSRCGTRSEAWMYNDGHWWVRRKDAFYYLDERSRAWIRCEPARAEPPA